MSRACDKTVYPDQQAAMKAIQGWHKDKRVMMSRKPATKAYFCEGCNGYHIHTEGKKRPKKRPSTEHSVFHRTPKEYGVLVIRNFTGRPL